MVMGHFHAGRYQTTDAFQVTFIREPVDNLISIYYFWQKLLDHGHPVHSRFLRERPHITDFARHPDIRELLSKTYFGGVNFDQFNFIGFHETRDADIDRLSAQLGVPLRPDLHHNQTPLSEERQALATQPALISQLTDLLARDVALYWKLRERAPCIR